MRPDSCLAVDNFYTVTVYEKGAEVIRVLKQLIGDELFNKGMEHYFEKFDGQSITIEDFLSSFEAVSGKDLSQFRLWYSQAGTPHVKVTDNYLHSDQTYTLTLEQKCNPTPGQEIKKPFVIPVKLSLFSPTTKKPMNILNNKTELVIELDKEIQSWTWTHIKEKPIPSILRGMTSPVHLGWETSRENLEFLANYETDGFNQWECIQKLSLKELTDLYFASKNKQNLIINKNYVTLYGNILNSALEKPELTSRLLQLPSIDYLVQQLPHDLDPEAVCLAVDSLETAIAETLNDSLWKVEAEINKIDKPHDFSFKSMGLRQLRNTIWSLLGHRHDNIDTLSLRFQKSTTMNEKAGLIEALNYIDSKERTEILNQFIEQWKDNALVVNKWLGWNAMFNQSTNLERVKKLSESTYFKASNPNKVRALYGAFATLCWRGFHNINGSGYSFFAEKILEVDALNPQTAARMCQAFENWYRLEPTRKELVRKTMEQIILNSKLSKNSYEILKRSVDFC